MNAHLVFFAIDIATIVCAALVGIRVLVNYPRLRAAQLVALICFDTICSVLLGRQDYSYWIPAAYQVSVGILAPLFNIARNLTAGAFMVLCHTLFSEQKRFPRWLLLVLIVQLLLEEPTRKILPVPMADTARIGASLLQAVFVGFALYWTLADWRLDLVESRRRTRAFTLFVIGFNAIASVLLTRVLIDPDTPANYLAHVLLAAMVLAILAFFLVSRVTNADGGFAFKTAPPMMAPVKPTAPSPAIAKLAQLMDGDHLYRNHGLTLKTIADRAGLPEYRLRKVIHEELGFQNLNAYLHTYRIREACAQLRDPGLMRTPILTIALSVGYQSINTFNRAFRNLMGTTPSAYRTPGEAEENSAPTTE